MEWIDWVWKDPAWDWRGAWLLPLFRLCAWGYPFPGLRGDKCKYQQVIFSIHSAKLQTKLWVGNDPFSIIKDSRATQCFSFSRWNQAESCLLAQSWDGTHRLCPRSCFPSETFPPWQAELLFLKPDTGLGCTGDDLVLLLIFFFWHRTGMNKEWSCALVSIFFSDIPKHYHSVSGQKKAYSQQNIEMKFLKSFPTPKQLFQEYKERKPKLSTPNQI